MITVEDIVSNQTGADVELTNYSYIKEKITYQKINFLYFMRDLWEFSMIHLRSFLMKTLKKIVY